MRQNWSQEEIDKLKEFYPHTCIPEMERMLERSDVSITHKALRLGLTRESPNWLKPVESLHLGGFDLGFVVGMLEGEGTISLYGVKGNGRLGAKVYWTNTKWELLAELQKLLNSWGEIYTQQLSGNRNPKHVYVVGQYAQIEQVLLTIEPFLITKKKQAQLVLEALNLAKSNVRRAKHDTQGRLIGTCREENNEVRQGEILTEIRLLNRRGLIIGGMK